MSTSLHFPRISRGTQRTVGLLLGIAIFAYAMSRMDFQATWEGIGQTDLRWFGAAFLVFYPSLPLRAIRWQLLLGQVSGHIRLLPLCSILFRAWTLNCALPGRTGDLYAAYLVREEQGLGGSRTAGTIFTSRVLDLVVLVLLVLVLLFGRFRHSLSGGTGPLGQTAIGIAALAVLGVLGIWLTRGLMRRFLPEEARKKYERFLHGFVSTATWWKGIPTLLLLTAVLWLLEAARLGLVMVSLGIDPPVAWTIFLALGAAILTVLPITPGGLGTVELFYQQLFQSAGIPPDLIGPVVLLDRAINYWFILLAGAVLFLVERRRGRARLEVLE